MRVCGCFGLAAHLLEYGGRCAASGLSGREEGFEIRRRLGAKRAAVGAHQGRGGRERDPSAGSVADDKSLRRPPQFHVAVHCRLTLSPGAPIPPDVQVPSLLYEDAVTGVGGLRSAPAAERVIRASGTHAFGAYRPGDERAASDDHFPSLREGEG